MSKSKSLSKTELNKLKKEKKKQQPKKKNPWNVVKDFFFYNLSETEFEKEYYSNKSGFDQIATFYIESLWTLPLISIHLESIQNRKIQNIRTFKPLEYLYFIRQLIKENNIKYFQLYNYFPDRALSNKIQKIAEFKKIPYKEAKSYYNIMSVINQKQIASILNPKEITEDDVHQIKEVIQKISRKNSLQETREVKEAKSKFLKDLNQEIIDEFQLTLFDIQFLKKTNEFLFIFIDKNNQKRYYKKPFYAEFYISKKNSIIENDYIMENSEDFIKYIITSQDKLNKLRYLLENNYQYNILNPF